MIFQALYKTSCVPWQFIMDSCVCGILKKLCKLLQTKQKKNESMIILESTSKLFLSKVCILVKSSGLCIAFIWRWRELLIFVVVVVVMSYLTTLSAYYTSFALRNFCMESSNAFCTRIDEKRKKVQPQRKNMKNYNACSKYETTVQSN